MAISRFWLWEEAGFFVIRLRGTNLGLADREAPSIDVMGINIVREKEKGVIVSEWITIVQGLKS